MVPVGCNIGSRFKCNLHTMPSPNTHLQFLKLHWNVTHYIPLSFLPRNGYNAYFSFCMASFSKNCITVVNYRIRKWAPSNLEECEVRNGVLQGKTAIDSYTYEVFKHHFFTTKTYTFTKTTYTKDAEWLSFMIHLDNARIHEPKREIRLKNTSKINFELK
jgi:hypothetical protein